MQISGKIIKVFDPRSGVSKGGKEWKKQEFVLETQERHPRHSVFSVFGSDRIGNSPLYVGANVCVDFDIDAREYQGKWYNDVEAWRVTSLDAATTATAAQKPPQAAPYQPQPTAQPQPQNYAPQPSQAAPFPPQVNGNGTPVDDGGNDNLPF